jgi:hypothetical protein
MLKRLAGLLVCFSEDRFLCGWFASKEAYSLTAGRVDWNSSNGNFEFVEKWLDFFFA